jgi:hypothetical protein
MGRKIPPPSGCPGGEAHQCIELKVAVMKRKESIIKKEGAG